MNDHVRIVAFASVAVVVVALVLRRIAQRINKNSCINAPLIPASFSTLTAAVLTACGLANLTLQIVAIAIGDIGDVTAALLIVYNFFSVLWIWSPDKDAAAVVVVLGFVFAFSTLIVQIIIKDLVLGSFLLMGVAACSVVDLFVYVVYVPFFENHQNISGQQVTVIDANASQIDQLRGQLLQIQTEINLLESGV